MAVDCHCDREVARESETKQDFVGFIGNSRDVKEAKNVNLNTEYILT